MKNSSNQKLPVVISILALGLSIFNSCVTYHFNNEQNMKWEALNQAKIAPSALTLIAYQELDTDAAMVKDWGYPITFAPVIKDGVYTGHSRVYNDLVFLDAQTSNRVVGCKTMVTVNDAIEEAHRLKLQMKDLKLRKHFAFVFSFRNTGQLSAHNVKVSLEIADEKGTKKPEYTDFNHSIRELAGGETFDITLNADFDLNVVLGSIEHFQVAIDYDSGGKPHRIERHLFYNMLANSWGLE